MEGGELRDSSNLQFFQKINGMRRSFVEIDGLMSRHYFNWFSVYNRSGGGRKTKGGGGLTFLPSVGGGGFDSRRGGLRKAFVLSRAFLIMSIHSK